MDQPNKKQRGRLTDISYPFKRRGENLNWEWVGTSTNSETPCVTLQVILEANANKCQILYSKWITSLGSPIPHRDDAFGLGMNSWPALSILDFVYGT